MSRSCGYCVVLVFGGLVSLQLLHWLLQSHTSSAVKASLIQPQVSFDNNTRTLPMKYLLRHFSNLSDSRNVTADNRRSISGLPNKDEACLYMTAFKNSTSRINLTYVHEEFHITLPKLMPHMLIDFVCERANISKTGVSKTDVTSVSKLILNPKTLPKQPHAVDSHRIISAVETCEYNFTVFVYPISSELSVIKVAEQARHNRTLHVCRKCILEQFALEYVLFDFFTQFCGRVSDPSKADFFYIPMVRDAELRWLMERGIAKNRPPSPAEAAMLDLIEKNSTDKFKDYFKVSDEWWLRNQGADHIVVMPAPVTNLRHERSARGFFHYMLHLKNPIFVAIEYSKSFISEYPVCSRRKNILVPYPTVDPELYNWSWKPGPINENRSALLFYSGGQHGDCMAVREGLYRMVKNSSRLPGILPSIAMNMKQREIGFLQATFCPIPVGDSPSSKRMYDVLNAVCIPVVLSDDLVWAFSTDSGSALDPARFSLQLPQSVVHLPTHILLDTNKYPPERFGRLPVSGWLLRDLLVQSIKEGGEYINDQYINPLVQILMRVPLVDIIFFRQQIQKVAPLYRFYKMGAMARIPIAHHKLPNGGAISQFASSLYKRKIEGINEIRDACVAERDIPGHKYLGRFPCDDGKK